MHRHPSLVLAFLAPLLPLASCEAIGPAPVAELDLWTDAAAGTADATLAELCAEYWEASLRADPFRATALGDPRYHGDVPLTSQRARSERAAEYEALLTRARAIPPARLNEADALTWELLVGGLEQALEATRLGLEDWTVDPIEGPHVEVLNLARIQPHGTARERRQLVQRWRSLSSYVRQASINLEYGKVRGKVASRTAVNKVVEQLGRILDLDPFDSPLVAIATGGGTWIELPPNGNVAEIAHERLGDSRRQRQLRLLNLHLQDGERLVIGTRILLPAQDDPLDVVQRGEFLYAVLRAVEEELYPALAGYRDVLRDEILPVARGDDRPGLVGVADGEATYRALIRRHTSLPLDECDPREIHEFGLAEVARIRGEIAALGEKQFGTRDVGAIQELLRNSPELHFTSRDEVEGKAVEALFAARARMSEYFGRLPIAPCEVVRIAPYEERDTTIAYYDAPAADGSRPGRYYINTYAPETRPRYEAEVLAYHEAIPGHHLQLAIAQELEEVPLFRRHEGSTAFVEGWALYTERLCDEMGLYSTDLDRLGVLSFDAWRACRLVVDTGIHAFGWSRARAIEYLFQNTLLARNNVENEVDRYIAWPGQALAYKIGQREILALRDEAKRARGASFSYPEFHDRILENGALPLTALRGVMERWLAK